MSLRADPSPDGLRLLRRYREATLQFHERRAEVRFVIDNPTGALVMPVEPGFAAASELTLHLPDEVTLHLQLAVTPSQIDRPESRESVDRWHAYHAAAGTLPPGRLWLICEIEAGKRPDSPTDVYGPEVLMQPNPLRSTEPRLVKLINSRRDRLARLCRKHAAAEVQDPLCVGVDPLGLDVRARFGVIRVEFDLEAATAEQAEALVNSMFEHLN